MSFMAATMGGRRRRRHKRRSGKLSARASCMRRELKKRHLKGKSKAQRIKLFKEASRACS